VEIDPAAVSRPSTFKLDPGGDQKCVTPPGQSNFIYIRGRWRGVTLGNSLGFLKEFKKKNQNKNATKKKKLKTTVLI